MIKTFVITFALFLVTNADGDIDLWEEFKTNNMKNYKSLQEETYRFSIFQNNLRKIEEHNVKYEQGIVSYFLKITKFADLSDEEFSNKMSCYSRPKINYTSKFAIENVTNVPNSIDWRSKDAVLEVKNQDDCGACYAFSTTGALEGQNAIKHNKRISLSEQELIDYTGPSYLNSGCNGGRMEYCFMYIKDYGGISTEKSYPYKGKAGGCSRGENAGIKVLGHVEVGMTENELMAAVGTVGPVSVAINSREIKSYGGGIFDSTCTDDINHGVLVVGYGTEDKKDYWIIKNSWGPKWGEEGYIRMARNKNLCGLGIDSTYPIIA